jgi:hypothetical protein
VLESVLIVHVWVGFEPAIDVDVPNCRGAMKEVSAFDRRGRNGGSDDRDVRLVVFGRESFFENKRDSRLVEVKRLAVIELRIQNDSSCPFGVPLANILELFQEGSKVRFVSEGNGFERVSRWERDSDRESG